MVVVVVVVEVASVGDGPEQPGHHSVVVFLYILCSFNIFKCFSQLLFTYTIVNLYCNHLDSFAIRNTFQNHS